MSSLFHGYSPGSLPKFHSHKYFLSSGLGSAGTAVTKREPAPTLMELNIYN